MEVWEYGSVRMWKCERVVMELIIPSLGQLRAILKIHLHTPILPYFHTSILPHS